MRKLLMMALALTTACGDIPGERPQATEVAFCRAEVPQILKNGNATFVVIYEARVNASGAVVDVDYVKPFGGVGTVSDCIATWKLGKDWANEDISILMQWQHGIGWTGFVLRSGSRSLEIVDPAPRDYWTRP